MDTEQEVEMRIHALQRRNSELHTEMKLQEVTQLAAPQWLRSGFTDAASFQQRYTPEKTAMFGFQSQVSKCGLYCIFMYFHSDASEIGAVLQASPSYSHPSEPTLKDSSRGRNTLIWASLMSKKLLAT